MCSVLWAPLRTPDCGQEAAVELPSLHICDSCLELCPAPQWAWPRCCSAQFSYSVSNLWGVFVKLSQGDQGLLPETHTTQKSQGRGNEPPQRMRAVFLHPPSWVLELICPQSRTARLLRVPDGGQKQMAARDRVAISELPGSWGPGPAFPHRTETAPMVDKIVRAVVQRGELSYRRHKK